MSTHRVALVRREQVAEGTLSLTFEKPDGFVFRAGQAIDLTLVDPPQTDAKGDRRAFSIVSAPYENEIVVATRLRDSAFKRILGTLTPGRPVLIDGPFGSLTLHRNVTRPAIFIAGGIGITPFMSMIREVAHADPVRVIKLIYSNHRPEDAAFLDELLGLEARHRGWLSVIPTMTGTINGKPWAGRTGLINADLVNSIIVRPSRPVFYIAGPPAMVSAIRQLLVRAGVDEDDIRAEDFSGY